MSALLGSALLEVAIGLMLTFFVLSSFCSALYEMIASLLKLRARDLESGIRALFANSTAARTTLADDVLTHPLVRAFGTQVQGWSLWKGKPSYIPASTFSLALLDVLRSGRSAGPEAPTATGTAANQLPELTEVLGDLVTLPNELAQARREVETWFDDAMERVSGQYKRRAQFWLFWIGLVVSLVFGVDSLRVASHLYTTPTVRAAVVAQAESSTASPPAAGSAAKSADAWLKDFQALNLPIGYGDPVVTPALSNDYISAIGKDLPSRLLGILLTTLALAQGSTFWFDLLKKVVNIRSAGQAPERSDKSGK